MVKKSIIVAIILLASYEVILRISVLPWDSSQNDKSANLITAQDYLYNFSAKEISTDTVILGTSISRKLITQALGDHFINLSFNAWTAYDGFGVIKSSRSQPACILIETNYLKSTVVQPELAGILEPISYYSAKILKSMRIANQPAGLLLGWGKSRMQTQIEALRDKKREDTVLYHLNLRQYIKEMNEKTPDSILAKRFSILKTMVEEFKKKQTTLIFYEVPIDPELQNTNSMTEFRKYFDLYFPRNEYKHISLPEKNNYVYSDGIHLTRGSALAYTLYLKNELKKLSSRN